ncbi:MAG: hypothetical protein ACREQY_08630, partial [Candidatus Binatia bacterium]
MSSVRGLLVFSLFLATVAVLSVQWVGCGDGDDFAVVVNGNVDEVTGADTSRAPSERRSFLAAVEGLVVGRAVAQPECPDEAEQVLACAESEDEDEFRCRGVKEETCAFTTSIQLDSDEDELGVFFCDDADDDGDCGDDETRAELTNDLGEVCNGDQVTLEDVDI